ncbi:ATP-binding cassette domain-containing protein [Mucilaginibacter sp. FT3.2]|uniref:ATP-binding cassette domain-containing protein n=1 Tax=Mucilaginibacter sp. FT3.2 TaxID=2723090 RepID=UPI001622E061|nr:ABC transporter ATP-binding protein [Mucilaginibacter sp. FT3.2]MBB6233568.1 ABC-type bacteriocin/lantibiotic exporter with double-glycine peptidase domain [Mucilaginibacter sp. FT3.2]
MKHIYKGIQTLLNTKEKNRLFGLILLDLFISALDILFLGLLLIVIGFYTTDTPVKKYFLLPATWFNKNSLLLIGAFLVLFCLKNWGGYLISRFQQHFFYDVATRLSKRNMLHYLKGDYMHFVNIDSSIHIRRISQQPIEFSSYILNNTQQVISQSILIFFTIGAILIYQPVLFLLLLLLLVPPVIILAYFIRKRSKQVREHTKLSSEKSIQHLQESLTGFVESNIYDKTNFLADRYNNYQQQLNNTIATQQTLQGLPSRLVEVFAIFGFFILVLVNKWSASGSTVDLLTIGVFMAAAYKIIPGIIKILNSTGQIKTYEFTLNDLLAVSEPTKAIKNEFLNIVDPINTIGFHNIRFSYKNQQVLNGINFEISSGDLVGISSASGRGKTTLINLLLGFLTAEAGYIYINGSVADVAKRQHYWQNIAYVKQQTYFIHDTIVKNITLSDDEHNPEKLAEVIAFCGLGPLLAGYPEGLNKIIRENGKNISGGQRQRISLARALYHDFDLLILDEPFGEMDQQAEESILIQLKQLAQQGKMILFITHNAASLAYCNKIIALND